MKSPALIVRSHFNVGDAAPERQALAWRERVSHMMDMPLSRAQLAQPFSAAIDRYAVGERVFTDSRTDPLTLVRSIARISTDNVRDFAFRIFLEGRVNVRAGSTGPRPGGRRDPPAPQRAMLALDMDQAVRMDVDACRVLTLFVPRTVVEATLPDAASIHGRLIDTSTSLASLLRAHMVGLSADVGAMGVGELDGALRVAGELFVAAFGKQAGLSGNARAAVRAAMFGQVRRYVDAHVEQPDLSSQTVLRELGLPRATLYRLFEHEGGIAAYISERKLRAAADEIARFPYLAVKDVAYAMGFNSASTFTRAFRRQYEMTPQDLRAHVLQMRRSVGGGA